jgi:hypothetical protein
MAISRIKVSTHGVIFNDRQSQQIVRDWLDETKLKVARIGENEIHARLGQVLRNPTGFYDSHIRTEMAGQYKDVVIHDGGVFYGPWLEGLWQRNQYTRFKGYKTFKRTRASLRKQMTPIAQAGMDRLIARLGG